MSAVKDYNQLCVCGHRRGEHLAFGIDDCAACECDSFEQPIGSNPAQDADDG